MKTRICRAEGHLIDSGILSSILNTILREGGDYRILSLQVGKVPEEISHLEIELIGTDEPAVSALSDKLTPFGVYEQAVPSAELVPADGDRHAPEAFYSTTNHHTEVYYQGHWYEAEQQRMDAAVVYDSKSDCFVCRKLRDLRKGDMVVCGSDSVRVFPAAAQRRAEDFAFMTHDVSSERSVDTAVNQVAGELASIRNAGGKTVAVCGPVVVHTGGADALPSSATTTAPVSIISSRVLLSPAKMK